ncbi:MAG: PA2169 family four-helix-bundle protein [Chitinophagaceae bacterium]|nr:PA2169 family four-helix-bundle protein [Chitinophagaceae bacterium]
MTTNAKLIDVLNDLIQINNDRIAGYDRAIVSVGSLDIDLKTSFRKLADQSEGYRIALTDQVIKLGGEAAEGTTGLGKIYLAWMEVKNTFTGDNRQSILDSCETGEDAALKAYREALASDADMSAAVRQLIIAQQAELKEAHDNIKRYRDLNEAVHA